MAENRTLQLVLNVKDNISGSLKGLNKQTDSTADSVKKLGKLMVTFFGARVLGGLAKESIELAAGFRQTQGAFNTLATSIGANANDILSALREASDGTIASNDLMIAANKAMVFGVAQNTEQFTGLMTFSRIAAREMGISVGQAFDNLATGIGRGSALILDNLGISLDFIRSSTEEYARSLGKTTDELTDMEKKQALTTAVLDKADTKLKELGGTLDLTAQERLEKVKTQVEETKTAFGTAFLPTLEAVTNQLFSFSDQGIVAEDSVEKLSKGIFRATNLILALGSAVMGGIRIIGALGAIVVQAGIVVVSAVRDMFNSFRNLKEITANVFKAIGAAMTGDFSGALDLLKENVKNTFTNTKKSVDEFKDIMGTIKDKVGSDSERTAELLNRAFFLEGFKPITVQAQKFAQNMKQTLGSEGTGKATEEAKDEIGKLKDKYKEFSNDAAEALFSVEQDHIKSMTSIRADIDKTKKAIKDLNQSFEQQRQSDTQNVAESILATEERIATLREDIAESTSEKQRRKLREQLDKEQDALEENAEFISSIEDAVNEARRRAGLSDLNRSIEDFKAKRAMAKTEFEERMAFLQQELQTAKNKEKLEVAAFQVKVTAIKQLQTQGLIEHQRVAAANFNITKDQIQKEIKLYERLAAAIAKVRGTGAPRLTGVSDINTNSAISNVNITVNGDVSGQELVNRVQDAIMQGVRLNSTLPI